MAAYDAIQSGTVGVTGTTGAVVRRRLAEILALIEKPAGP
jgi:hypothetical protein